MHVARFYFEISMEGLRGSLNKTIGTCNFLRVKCLQLFLRFSSSIVSRFIYLRKVGTRCFSERVKLISRQQNLTLH